MLRILLICLSLQLCESQFRIGQGVRANFDDWKFVVKLQIFFDPNAKESIVGTCTGTLIHYQKMMSILTAGHCFQRQKDPNDSQYPSNAANLRNSTKSEDVILFQGTIRVFYPIEISRGGSTEIKATFKDETVMIPAELFKGGLDNSDMIYRPMDFALVKVNNRCLGAAKFQFLIDFEAIDSEDLFDQACQTAGWGVLGTVKEMHEGKAGFPPFLQVAKLMALNTGIQANRQKCLDTARGMGDIADLPLCLVHNPSISEKPIIGVGDSGGPTFCDVEGKRKFAGVTSSRETVDLDLCHNDGTRDFQDYADFMVVAVPTHNVIKFISKHEWSATMLGCRMS